MIHRDREAARRSAASANAETNLRPFGEGALVVLAVVLVTLLAVRPGGSVVDGFQIVVGPRREVSCRPSRSCPDVGDVHHVAIVGHGILICVASCEDPDASAERQRGAVAALAVVVDASDR